MADAGEMVERLRWKGNERGLYDTTKLGPELVAFLDDRRSMLAALRDEMSEGYRTWLDDAVDALATATKRCAEAADLIDSLTKTSEADVERVIASLYQRLRDGDDASGGWTNAGMDDAFFRWCIIERELRAALEAMKGGAA